MIGAPPSAPASSPQSEDVQPSAPEPRPRSRRALSSWPVLSSWPALTAVAGLAGASAAALALVRHQGVGLNGDEPGYLVEAESIGRYFTLNTNPGYNFIITHHIVYPFTEKAGPNVAASMIWEAVKSHHLYLPIHSIGISVLLAVPILAGPTVAVLAFMLMLAALAVGVVHLAGLVAGARSPWRFALAGLFLAPTYLLATTQVYPDLMTGLVVAIIVLLVALFEVERGCTTAQVVTGGLLLAVLPWLAQKDIPLTFLLVVLLVVARRRTVMTTVELAWLALPALVSTFGVVMFNRWAYGRSLGTRNPVSIAGIETWTRSAALVFDRRSGILIQLPVLLVGVAAVLGRASPDTPGGHRDGGDGSGHRLRERHRTGKSDRRQLRRSVRVASGPPGPGLLRPLPARPVAGPKIGGPPGRRHRGGALGDRGRARDPQ